MKLRVCRTAYPVTTLGPGRRYVVWVQGCPIHCPGCCSKETWDPLGGEAVDVGALAGKITETAMGEGLDGLTISGGEPTEQSEALAELIGVVRAAIHGFFDVLVFTGRAAEEAQRRAPALWDAADAFVCGPYSEANAKADALRASGNQEIVTFTDEEAARIAEYLASNEMRIELEVHDDGFMLVGLPKQGDLQRMNAALRERGVTIGGCSWE